MGGRKKKGSRLSNYLTFGSAPGSVSSSGDPNPTKNPPRGHASVQADPDPRPEQSSGGHGPQQAALYPATTSRSSRFFNKLNWRLRPPSPSPGHGVERPRSTPELPTVTTSSQSLAVHSSYSDFSILPTHGPSPHDLSPPTGSGGSPSSSAQGSSTMSVSVPIIQISDSQTESIASENPAPPSTCSPHIPTSTCHVQAPAEISVHPAVLPQTKSASGPGTIEPSSQVWAKALEMAKKKLSDNNLRSIS